MKTSYSYLERGFPENLEPAFTSQSTKRKRFLVERKKRILKRSIRQSLRTLVKPFFSSPTKEGRRLKEPEHCLKGGVSLAKKDHLTMPLVKDMRIFPEKRGEVKKNQPSSSTFERSGGFEGFVDTNRDTNSDRNRETNRERNPSNVEEKLTFLQSKSRRYKFIFPLHRLKGELSKRESQYGKIELYKKQIQEKRKLSFIYGSMSKNSIKKLVKQARNLSSTENPPTKGLVTLLESRLDVALFRASFFSSIPMARQWINHNKVIVNQNKVRSPGYQLRGGDCIEVLSLSASSLKEKIKERIAKILPFRRSRKKLVNPSLVESYCSIERLFPREKTSQTSSISGENFLERPTLIKSFSLIKNHLQSIWEKSMYSQSSWRANKESSLPQSFSFKRDQKIAPLFSQLVDFPAKRKKKEKRERTLGREHFLRQMFGRKSPLSITKIHYHLQRGVAFFGRLRKKEGQPLDFLNAKQALLQPRNRLQRLAGLQISGLKPLHLEISYKLLTAIFLYSPQKVAYPANLDLPLIIRSFK